MPSSDRPYLVERPDDLRRRWDTCPVAGLDRTKGPEWALERWKVVRDLIVGWYGDDRPDAESVPDLLQARAGWLDPVQRLMVERLFAGWRAMFSKEAGVTVDLEPPSNSVFDHERDLQLTVATTFGFERPDGSHELVRLKTGRHPSGPDDAAVLNDGRQPGVTFLDGLVAEGVADEIVEPPDATTRISELFELAGRNRRMAPIPGRHCFMCSSAPRCGEYPLVAGGRVYVSTRSLTVSKSQLGWIGTCSRRVAWDRAYQVTTEEDGELDMRPSRATGILFHAMAAKAIASESPDDVVEMWLADLASSDAAELRRLWGNHLQLWSDHSDPEARSTERPAGFTLMESGPYVDSRGRERVQPVAVTMIGILDVTGRESDGTPMVVEHRTGVSGEHGHLELALYAISAAESVRRFTGAWPETLAVHLHVLGSGKPECIRSEFDRGRLESALQALREAAVEIASWHPHNTLDPGYQTGPWCDSCRHRPVCEQFRG